MQYILHQECSYKTTQQNTKKQMIATVDFQPYSIICALLLALDNMICTLYAVTRR